MSRIGNRILTLPDGVSVTVEPNMVKVSGPKGNLEVPYKDLIKVELKDNTIITTRANEQKHTRQLHGTYNSLIQGAIVGVSEGYKKELEIKGVGYKGKIAGQKLNMQLGYSHDINYEVPQGITVTMPSATEIIVEGIDKQKVGQVAAQIRAYKTPEPYKGKGVRYKDEYVIRKVGKTAGK